MDRRVFLEAAIAGWQVRGAANQGAPSEIKTVPASAGQRPYYEFSPDGKSCFVKRQDTPVPWLNLLSNDRFLAWLAHDGTIVESCFINKGINRLTNPGASGYVYLRDRASGQHFLLNRPGADSQWSSEQGLGYTRVTHAAMGISATCTYFVPRRHEALVWLLSVKNSGPVKRTLDVFSVVEWSLGDMNYFTVLPGGDFFSLCNTFKRVESRNEMLLATNRSWGGLQRFEGQKSWPWTGILFGTEPLQAFDSAASSFWGKVSDDMTPESVRRGQCGGSEHWGFADWPIGALQHPLAIEADGERKLAIVVGMARTEEEIGALRTHYSTTGAAEKDLAEVRQFWDDYVTRSIRVTTPERDIDRLINIWIKYQLRASMLENMNTGRIGSGVWCPAYPYGSGRVGDFRETANVPCDNRVVEEDLLDTLHGGPLLPEADLHFAYGSPTIIQTDLEIRWRSEKLPYPGDGRSYWPYPVWWHIRETGDLSLLQRTIEYRGQHPWMPANGSGSLWDCIRRAIEFALSGLSDRGLPRINPGLGDWNDTLNLLSREGKAESVLTATELCYMLRECADMADAFGEPAQASEWRSRYRSIQTAVNKHAWDGNWYIRAFSDEGEPIGTSRNTEGRIYLEPQAYAVLSGVASGERATQCLNAVDELLMTEYGPRLCAPAYTRPDRKIGLSTSYAPGWRENGAIWNRTNAWTVMANCVAGRAEQAFELYRRCSINHASENTNIDRFQFPPWAYPEFLVGEGPDFGRGQLQWCVGKAGSMWRAYAYYILGVRPEWKGLLVAPQIPHHWTEFKITRPFRGAQYEIVVRNPRGLTNGVTSLLVDGKLINGNHVPLPQDGRAHRVEAVLGT